MPNVGSVLGERVCLKEKTLVNRKSLGLASSV